MTDDEAPLYRAVLANPGDDAPRLIYADWLDERGDPRGEYLRLDSELARPRRLRFLQTLQRLKEVRAQLDPAWVVAVSRGWFDRVGRLDLTVRDRELDLGRVVPTAYPSWAVVEEAVRGLNRRARPSLELHLRGPDGWTLEGLAIHGGPGAWWIDGRARADGSAWDERVYWDASADQSKAIPLVYGDDDFVIPAERVCGDLGVVLRAARWWYYHGIFGPDLPWKQCTGPGPPAHPTVRLTAAGKRAKKGGRKDRT
ncbi:MAG TPA: TIGR02996 domain-containing protein [Gemmataceae bacterium]|nr:TIGR02996 domain-containing protein [Gemmataceae bacterium]